MIIINYGFNLFSILVLYYEGGGDSYKERKQEGTRFSKHRPILLNVFASFSILESFLATVSEVAAGARLHLRGAMYEKTIGCVSHCCISCDVCAKVPFKTWIFP